MAGVSHLLNLIIMKIDLICFLYYILCIIVIVLSVFWALNP